VLPLVYGDAEKLHQVFINLFNNAQHAMEEGGELIVSTENAADEVLVSVQDSGSGIPDAIRNKIFDPFFTTKEVGKGTGLGLSVTYGIVQEHNGTIDIESPVVDPVTHTHFAGTVFHMRFPTTEKQNVNDEEHQ
jgi:signal transduction histidine kinase